jgi:hypothetical protein
MKNLFVFIALFAPISGYKIKVVNNETSHEKLIFNISTSYQTQYYDELKNNPQTMYYESIAQNCTNNVFIVAGGSLAANTGGSFSYTSSDNVLMWDGSLPGWRPATYPITGNDGTGSSPWLIFGQNRAKSSHQPVCLIGISRIGSTIKDWHPRTGKYNSLMVNAYQLMSKYTSNGYVLWSQGEANANIQTYSKSYGGYLYDLLKQSSVNTTWFVSQTSYSPWNQNNYEDYVRSDQQMIVTYFRNNVYAGPNTDSVCQSDRYDDFYLNEDGIKLVASGWVQSFTNQSKIFSLGTGHCDVRFYTIAEVLVSLLFLLMAIALGCTCIVGCWYAATNNRHHNRVYYTLNRQQDPAQFSLIPDTLPKESEFYAVQDQSLI